jgi:hypothetical protein
MSITSRTRNLVVRGAAAIVAVAALGGLGAGSASAESTAGAGTGTTSSIFCWKEYDFTLSGSTVTATAFKDCTNLEVPQPLPVTIQGYFWDEGGPSGWVTWKSGVGVVKTSCIPGFPMWFRHSATQEIIYC